MSRAAPLLLIMGPGIKGIKGIKWQGVWHMSRGDNFAADIL